MATNVQRYKLYVNPDKVQHGIDPTHWGTLTIANVAPVVTVDITIDDAAKEDLDVTMTDLGWVWVMQL
jgi:hypothetical protein